MALLDWRRRLEATPVVLAPREAYARWAAVYPPHPHNPLMVAEQAAVEARLPVLAGRRALDLGCGTGRYLRVLQARGARVVGVDLSRAMLSYGRDDGMPRLQADVTALPLADACMDVVLSGLALNDVDDLDGAIAECARVLVSGGVLVYSVVHPRGAHDGWRREFDAGGQRYAVAGRWHARDAHLRACQAAGLRVSAVDEPDVAGAPSPGPVALVVTAEKLS